MLCVGRLIFVLSFTSSAADTSCPAAGLTSILTDVKDCVNSPRSPPDRLASTIAHNDAVSSLAQDDVVSVLQTSLAIHDKLGPPGGTKGVSWGKVSKSNPHSQPSGKAPGAGILKPPTPTATSSSGGTKGVSWGKVSKSNPHHQPSGKALGAGILKPPTPAAASSSGRRRRKAEAQPAASEDKQVTWGTISKRNPHHQPTTEGDASPKGIMKTGWRQYGFDVEDDYKTLKYKNGKKDTTEEWNIALLAKRVTVWSSATPTTGIGVEKILKGIEEDMKGKPVKGVVITGTHGSTSGVSVLGNKKLGVGAFALEDIATVKAAKIQGVTVIDLQAWLKAHKTADAVQKELTKTLKRIKPDFIMKAWCFSKWAAPIVDQAIVATVKAMTD